MRQVKLLMKLTVFEAADWARHGRRLSGRRWGNGTICQEMQVETPWQFLDWTEYDVPGEMWVQGYDDRFAIHHLDERPPYWKVFQIWSCKVLYSRYSEYWVRIWGWISLDEIRNNSHNGSCSPMWCATDHSIDNEIRNKQWHSKNSPWHHVFSSVRRIKTENVACKTTYFFGYFSHWIHASSIKIFIVLSSFYKQMILNVSFHLLTWFDEMVVPSISFVISPPSGCI